MSGTAYHHPLSRLVLASGSLPVKKRLATSMPVQNRLTTVSTKSSTLRRTPRHVSGGCASFTSSASSSFAAGKGAPPGAGKLGLATREDLTQLFGEPVELGPELGVERADVGLEP